MTNAPDGNNQGVTPFSNETGSPGVFRFFTQPLTKQMSWLMPFALISILLALFAAKIKLPLESNVHKALLLWGGWLMTCVAFFSMVSGIFHAYYAIMLAPALGAMVGVGFAQLWTWSQEKKWASGLLIAAAILTFGFQIFATIQYGEQTLWLYVAGALLLAGGLLMLMWKKLAYFIVLASMLIVPAYWTAMTTASSANQNLPTAYSGMGSNQQVSFPDGARQQGNNDGGGSRVNNELVNYLQANTQDVEYLAAVPSSHEGSTMVLATGRPVLFMGGFGGQDDVVSAEDLAQMVADRRLRYVLYSDDNRGGKQDIANWLASSCTVVPEFSNVSDANQPPAGNRLNGQSQVQGPDGGGPGGASTLYMCG